MLGPDYFFSFVIEFEEIIYLLLRDLKHHMDKNMRQELMYNLCLSQPSLARLLQAGGRTVLGTGPSTHFMSVSQFVSPAPKVSRWKAAASLPADQTRPGPPSALFVKVGVKKTLFAPSENKVYISWTTNKSVLWLEADDTNKLEQRFLGNFKSSRFTTLNI